jgi:glyoxylase-like metal-dependent hydrolase (beta-lactamase superfamily II)
MEEFRVTTLRLGWLEVDKSQMTYQYGAGTRVEIPVWAAAIEGAGLKILVDTGIKDHERWDRELNRCWREGDESIDEALAEIGWKPSDVDVVINSHLHYDHAENNTHFRRATFFVSRAEWDYAQAPIPSQRRLYDYEWTDEVVNYLRYSLVAVDDYDIVPGLRLFQTPGHTRGHQSVLVNTSQGLLCVAGDAACFPENFERPTPPGGATSIEQAFESLERIRCRAERVVMNHDPGLSKFQSENFPLMPAQNAEADSWGAWRAP